METILLCEADRKNNWRKIFRADLNGHYQVVDSTDEGRTVHLSYRPHESEKEFLAYCEAVAVYKKSYGEVLCTVLDFNRLEEIFRSIKGDTK